MNWRNQLALIVLATCLTAPLTLAPQTASAQDEEAESKPAAETGGEDEAGEDGGEDDEGEATEDGEDGEEGEEDEGTGEERESAHGDYEWKPSYGGGVEYGLFFSDLSRWNSNLLAPDHPLFEAGALNTFTVAAEASLLEGTRLTAFFGISSPFSSNPSITALYGGIEPAFAFRSGLWEMSIGMGVGVGTVGLETDAGNTWDSGLVVLRPALELRRYLGEFAAAYVRFGFNQWLPFNGSGEGMTLNEENGTPVDISELNEGAPWIGIGARVGHYPEHIKVVPDTDGDGLRDDIDDCVDEKEDEDGFEDYDGCPDPDNDQDGVPDEKDKCPDEAEDMDEWKDEDGCPEEDDDHDEDGILSAEDDCPRKAEDKDGFEDEDGCPDPDNDQDGVMDENDECRDEAGIPANDGCPSEVVTIEEDSVAVSAAIDFEPAWAEGERPDSPDALPESVELTDAAESTLTEVGQTLQANPELTVVEIAVHTAEGPDELMKKLSQLQGDAVKSYLVDQGVEEGRLKVAAHGDTKPVAPESTEEDAEEGAEKAPKARVEFNVVERDEQ